jgi:AMP nucleosidase
MRKSYERPLETLSHEFDEVHEAQVARDTLERYSGSPIEDFQPFVMVTNFSHYLRYFAKSRGLKICEGSMFQVVHSPEEKISFLDFHLGSPAAALVVDLFAHTPVKVALLVGMCGGLRKYHNVGDYFVPVAGIRGEGTSDFYFPPEVPAMANFLVQKKVTGVLEETQARYHTGIVHTTNKRFWEFNRDFRQNLMRTRPQAIDMECATLFMASYYHRVPLGALLLISDLPLNFEGIKTKKSSEGIFANYTEDHVEKGVKVLHAVEKALVEQVKGPLLDSSKSSER